VDAFQEWEMIVDQIALFSLGCLVGISLGILIGIFAEPAPHGKGFWYKMSNKHYVKTIYDCTELAAKLPPDRAKLFLKELTQGILHQAGVIVAARSIGSDASFPGGFTWIDDDKGEETMNLKVRFKFK
jgi:hypothetical protein